MTGSSSPSLRRILRLFFLAVTALLPGFLKKPIYRKAFGFEIGRRVRLGVTLIDAGRVRLGDEADIGHLNIITRVEQLELEEHARIGVLNIVRGGRRVHLGPYAQVLRLNVLNAIPDHDCTTDPRSELDLDVGAVVVSGHRIDYTDHVSLGKNVIVGGRNSSFWTHNRQRTAPIRIGHFCYLGSEIRIAPGGELPDRCILALGSVLSGRIETPGSLVGGVPARIVRPLNSEDEELISRKVLEEIPDELLEVR